MGLLRHIGVIGILTLLALPVLAASPRTNYLLYCSGCHLVNGEGNQPNVPTLHKELGRMMEVSAMREYLVRIPGSAQAPITDQELTDVINWVLEQWNTDTLPKDFQMLTLEEVTAARKRILADPLRYRTENWKDFSE